MLRTDDVASNRGYAAAATGAPLGESMVHRMHVKIKNSKKRIEKYRRNLLTKNANFILTST